MRSKVSKEEFYNEVERIYKEQGSININIWNEFNSIGVGFRGQLNKYSGIKSVLEELNLEYRYYNEPSKEEKLNDLKKVFEEHGDITKAIYEKYGNFSNTAIMTDFKSWNNIRSILGVKQYKRNYTKEEVLYDILTTCKNNHSSTYYRKHGNISTIVTDRFGGWTKLVEELGWKPLNKKIGKEEMIKQVEKVYDEFGFISRQLINDNCEFTYQAFTHSMNGRKGINGYFGKDVYSHERESSNSIILYKILVSLFGKDDVEKEHTFDWLVNSETGYHMYCDYYIKSINLAIEYDGEQHFKRTRFFYKTDEAFDNQLKRDSLKNKLLLENNINLIRFKYSDSITKENVIKCINDLKVTNL